MPPPAATPLTAQIVGFRAQTVGDAAEAVLGHGLALAAAGQLGEILARAEGLLAGAGDHDDADALILLRLVHDVFHGGRGHCIDSVALLRGG